MNKISHCKTMKNIKCLKPDLKSELTNHYVRLPKSNFECLKAQNKLFSFKYIKLNVVR